MGADILAKVEERWASPRRELGPCLVWREGEPTIRAAGRVYGRIYDPAIKRSDAAHLVVWRRCYPETPIPKGMTIGHTCHVTLCQRPDHLHGPVTRAAATRQRPAVPKSTAPTADTFAIALFSGIDRPAVQQQTVSLDELVALLGRFEMLADKRRGRCWSPTKYADGATSRHNAGVEAVSCLVFDCDRVTPDPDRLAGVCWIGHTTWSHTPTAPRWRVVIPLVAPVPATQWREVWQRARAALCPEADPSCKDPSRLYYLPGHALGAARETTYHAGPLPDPTTLPAPPRECRRTALRHSPSATVLRAATDRDRRRGEGCMRKVLADLETTPAGGRNNALNSAAWTLGRWVAGGALDQAEVEDALYAAAERSGLVSDPKDGPRKTWATIRSGFGAGLREPIDLDADDRPATQRRRRRRKGATARQEAT